MKRLTSFLIQTLALLLLSLPSSAEEAINAARDDAQPSTHRPRVALVLGGGGAKGAATVGVLKEIERQGIAVDMIVGTSIGSIVGGLYSVGYTSAQLDSMFRSQAWLDLLSDRSADNRGQVIAKEDGVTYVLGFPIQMTRRKRVEGEGKRPFGFGLLKGDSIVATLQRMADTPDSIDFDSLPIPFRCVAVDVGSFEEVVLSSGSLPIAMRASMAIPLAFRPVQLDGRTLMDGGLLNNLPVDVAREMGADYVIAVDLTVNKHEGKDDDDEDLVANTIDRVNIPGLVKWAIRRPDLEKYRDNCEQADVYINPQLKGYKAQDFSARRVAEMIDIGEKAGRGARKQLKGLKEKVRGHSQK